MSPRKWRSEEAILRAITSNLTYSLLEGHQRVFALGNPAMVPMDPSH